MLARHLSHGRHAEQFARHWLEARGLTHVIANFRCRYGELDLVMRDRGCLVVIEVRYRRHKSHGSPLDTVSAAKRWRIALATDQLLQRYSTLGTLPLRFDVIGLTGPHRQPDVEWRKHAFSFDTD